MDNISVKQNIRNFRKTQQLTQSEMAEKLGISRTAYRNIENGDTRLISESIGRIAEILDIDTDELVLGYSPESIHISDSGTESRLQASIEQIKRKHEEETAALRSEISGLKSEMENLRRFIEMQQDLIKTKDEIISMLKRLDSKSGTE